MLSIAQHSTVEDASRALFPFIVNPENWVALELLAREPSARPGQNASYQRQVGPLSICASVDVTKNLDVYLRVAFRAPGLSPMKAADHLEAFLKEKLPLLPKSEWQVHIDQKRWIHFIRRYAAPPLAA